MNIRNTTTMSPVRMVMPRTIMRILNMTMTTPVMNTHTAAAVHTITPPRMIPHCLN